MVLIRLSYSCPVLVYYLYRKNDVRVRVNGSSQDLEWGLEPRVFAHPFLETDYSFWKGLLRWSVSTMSAVDVYGGFSINKTCLASYLCDCCLTRKEIWWFVAFPWQRGLIRNDDVILCLTSLVCARGGITKCSQRKPFKTRTMFRRNEKPTRRTPIAWYRRRTWLSECF